MGYTYIVRVEVMMMVDSSTIGGAKSNAENMINNIGNVCEAHAYDARMTCEQYENI